MLKDIKGAIFDMDGTIIDSMWIWEKIDVEYLEKKRLKMPDDLKDNIEHLSFDETAKYFKEKFNLTESVDEIKCEWNDMAFDEYSNNVLLKPGAKEFLTLLKSKDVKIGLATSNNNMLVEAVLKKHGIFHLFDNITTTGEVSRGKNYPDVYLLAAERLCVKPEDCVIFEDILPAVIGAKASGATVIGVYDEYSEHQRQEIIKLADKFISNYEELTEAV